MCHGIILGVVGGLLVAKLIRRFRHGGFRHGGCGGGHHSHGGRWGRRRGRGDGGGGPGVWFLSRRLGLDPVQEAEVEAIFIDVRDSIHELREGGRGWIDEALQAVAADDFDRSRVDNAAAQQGVVVDRLRGKLVDATQKLHEILTPDQRKRLASLRGHFPFGRSGDAPERPPGTGPYRT